MWAGRGTHTHRLGIMEIFPELVVPLRTRQPSFPTFSRGFAIAAQLSPTLAATCVPVVQAMRARAILQSRHSQGVHDADEALCRARIGIFAIAICHFARGGVVRLQFYPWFERVVLLPL